MDCCRLGPLDNLESLANGRSQSCKVRVHFWLFLERFLENKIISSGGFRVKSHSFITIYSFHNYINEPGTFQIKLIILYSKYDFIIILIVYYYHIILLL